MPELKITFGNQKTKELERLLIDSELGAGRVGTFDLPAGYACPNARLCLSKAVNIRPGEWRIEDGEECQWRCYAASQEVLYPSVRRLRHRHRRILHQAKDKIDLLSTMVEFSEAKYIRLHSSGDFYNRDYFDAWLQVAREFPNRIIYGYTKMTQFIMNADIPENFRFNLSLGGTQDGLTETYHRETNFPVTGVAVNVVNKIGDEILPILSGAWTELAVLRRRSFAIPVHGTQPAGSRAGKAVGFWRRTLENQETS